MARWIDRQALRSFCAILVMSISVFATYLPIKGEGFPAGARSMLTGLDFMDLHVRRLRYAHEALFGPGHYVPG